MRRGQRCGGSGGRVEKRGSGQCSQRAAPARGPALHAPHGWPQADCVSGRAKAQTFGASIPNPNHPPWCGAAKAGCGGARACDQQRVLEALGRLFAAEGYKARGAPKPAQALRSRQARRGGTRAGSRRCIGGCRLRTCGTCTYAAFAGCSRQAVAAAQMRSTPVGRAQQTAGQPALGLDVPPARR